MRLPYIPLRSLPIWTQPLVILVLVLGAAWVDHSMHSDGPVLAWVNLLLFVVVLILNEYLGPKPKLQDAKPGGIGDFNFPTATEGRTIPLLWGENLVKGPNVVWYGDVEAVPISKSQKTGLWSKKDVIIGYFYRVAAQMALCRGPNVELVSVKIGEDVGYSGPVLTTEQTFDIDKINLFGGPDLGTGGVQATVEFFPGNDTQSVSTYLDTTARQRPAPLTTAPRYTGTCYFVMRGLTSDGNANRGAYVGTSTQIRPWSFTLRRFPALFPGQAAGQNKIGTQDANPINVIYEILTNQEWGLGELAGDIDTGTGSTFLLAADEMITEANGFSMVLERSTQAVDQIILVENQIDGLIYMDPTSGKWSIALARANTPWTSATPRKVNETNAKFSDFTRGSWEDTTNEIQIKYWKRIDEYKESHVVAHDMANIQIQGAGTVTTGKVRTKKITSPGVKTTLMAENLAWRILRVQSYPVARVKFLLDRTFWDLRPGEVVEWTNATLGFTDLAMRISNVNFGKAKDGTIEANAVQDIFLFSAASYGDPNATDWTEPTLDVVAFPVAQQKIFECPRAILVRDPEFAGDDTVRKVFCSARRQTIESFYEIRHRTASGAPSGSFGLAGDVAGFMMIGELDTAITDGGAYPTTAITITPTPDASAAMIAEFFTGATVTDLGQSLTHLCLVGNEFILPQGSSVNGLNVDLDNVYRGALDSAQENHAAATPVHLLFVGSGITDTNFPAGNQVDIKLIPFSHKDELAEASAVTVNMTLNKRVIRPYPPAATRYNASGSDFGDPALEGVGSGLNGVGIDIRWRARRFDTSDEITDLLATQTVDASTEFEVEMRSDPTGPNTLIGTKVFTTGLGPENFTRLEILENTAGAAVGVELEVRIRVRHDIGVETNLIGLRTFTHRITPTSSLTGQFAMGKQLNSVALATYTTAATGVFTVNIGGAYTTGAVTASVNAGAFNSVIATGLTTGTVPSTTSGDTIALRHESQDLGQAPNFVELKDPSSVSVAFGLFLD